MEGSTARKTRLTRTMAAIKSGTSQSGSSNSSLQGPREGQDLEAYVAHKYYSQRLNPKCTPELRHLQEGSSGILRKQDMDTTKKSTADYSGDESVQPRRLNASSVETPSYQNLHRELLLSHKRGLLLEGKPELKRVLEQRRLELHRGEEMARRRPSDLETELRKRQQKLEEYEREEIRLRENQQKVPEFVRVKDNLRRTQASEQ